MQGRVLAAQHLIAAARNEFVNDGVKKLNARRIMMVPVGVVAQAAGVASFPFLAALAAKGEEGAFDETLRVALRRLSSTAPPRTIKRALAATVKLIFPSSTS